MVKPFQLSGPGKAHLSTRGSFEKVLTLRQRDANWNGFFGIANEPDYGYETPCTANIAIWSDT